MMMIEEQQVSSWIERQIISSEQASKILEEIASKRKRKNSHISVITLAIVGALFIGIGVMLFISAKWHTMAKLTKIFLAMGSTFGSFFTGYFLKYKKENFPNVGGAFIFLSALLFGATLFLIVNIYYTQEHFHWIVLLWMVGIFPIIYVMNSPITGALLTGLFFIWTILFLHENLSDFFFLGPAMKVVFLSIFGGCALAWFGVGRITSLFSKFTAIGRIYQLLSLCGVLFLLFLFSFRFMTEYPLEFSGNKECQIFIYSFFTGTMIFFGISMLVDLFYHKPKSIFHGMEDLIALAIAGIFSIPLLFPLPPGSLLYCIIFNILFATVVSIVIWRGYQRQDSTIVTIGFFSLGFLIIVRYFDFFWSLFSRSLFFMIGGILLVGLGILFEKKRRALKKQLMPQEE